MALQTPEEFQKTLFDKFNALTNEEFNQLLGETQRIIYVLNMDVLSEEEEQRIEFIKSIRNFCKENKNITFKQWKALNTFISVHKKNLTTKQF